MIIITILKGKMMTAKRFILNETSYHGQGAAAAIIDEIKSRGFNKALIVTGRRFDQIRRRQKNNRPA